MAEHLALKQDIGELSDCDQHTIEEVFMINRYKLTEL